MREIKFRAWDIPEKEMYGWYAIRDAKNLGSVEDKEVIFMQYTGLKDKNDKEIYEGDILKSLGRELDKCIWYTPEIDSEPAISGFTFTPVRKIGGWAAYETGWVWAAEVIGNIYENPELLK